MSGKLKDLVIRHFNGVTNRMAVVATIILVLAGNAGAHVVVLAPNGGEKLAVGIVVEISWQIAIAHNTQNWDLWYSTTGGSGPWIPIEMNLPPGNTSVGSVHTFEWTIPDAVSSQCRVRVRMDNTGTDYEDISNANFSIVTTTVDIVAANYDIQNGTQVSGDLASTANSDDSYLKFRPFVTKNPAEPPVSVVFSGTLPSDTPSSLSITLEASTGTVGLNQSIEMFNWNTSQFEQVAAQAASFNQDSVVTIDLTANISDFVLSGTGTILTRTDWRATGLVLAYPWTISIDQVVWTVEP